MLREGRAKDEDGDTGAREAGESAGRSEGRAGNPGQRRRSLRKGTEHGGHSLEGEASPDPAPPWPTSPLYKLPLPLTLPAAPSPSRLLSLQGSSCRLGEEGLVKTSRPVTGEIIRVWVSPRRHPPLSPVSRH